MPFKLTHDEELQLCLDYQNSLFSLEFLSQKWKITQGSVRNIVKRHKITKRTFKHYKNLISVDENYFECIDSEEKAYHLGFIAADGHIRLDNKLVIALAIKDLTILEKFKKSIKADQSIKFDCVRSEKIDYCRFVISRKKICDDLTQLGIGHEKSKTMRLPDLSNKLKIDWVRGLFDGDGNWYVNKNKNTMEFSIVSPICQFIVELRKYLAEECNLNPEIKIKFHRNGYHLTYSGNNVTKRIFDWMYKNCSIKLNRKYEYALNHFNTYKEINKLNKENKKKQWEEKENKFYE